MFIQRYLNTNQHQVLIFIYNAIYYPVQKGENSNKKFHQVTQRASAGEELATGLTAPLSSFLTVGHLAYVSEYNLVTARTPG